MKKKRIKLSEPSLDLYKHQRETVKFSEDLESIFDTSDAGTGKTFAHAVLWAKRRLDQDGGTLLVICPKSIMESVWFDEIHKLYPNRFHVQVADAQHREQAFEPGADVYITNIDAATWLVKKPDEWFQEREFETLIIDESEAYKHPTSARSKAIAKIVVNRAIFYYVHLLTGTPWAASIVEMWHQLYILDGGTRLGPNFYQFRNTICIPEQTGPRPEHRKWVDRPGAEEVVSGLIRDITIRHRFEDCTDIPPNVMRRVAFRLSPEHRHVYEEMKAQALIELNQTQVTAVHAAALRTKLLQITSGAVYGAHSKQVIVDSGRYELILELIKERNHPVIVFFMWDHQRDQLQALADKLGVSHEHIDGSVPNKRRAEIVKAFQAGDYRALWLHPQSAAHGLTLTRAKTAIWASPPSLPNLYKQGSHRIYRIGQTDRTETILILAQDTLEGRVYSTLQERKGRLDNLMELLE